MSSQADSRHFLLTEDTVRDLAGVIGRVVQSTALWAVVRWENGREEETEQLDPRISVIERATRE